MKVQINAFITYRKPYEWEEDSHGFIVTNYNPEHFNDTKEALVFPYSFEVDVPDNFDPRPALVKALEEQKKEAHKKFAETVMNIDRQINELLALEHTA